MPVTLMLQASILNSRLPLQVVDVNAPLLLVAGEAPEVKLWHEMMSTLHFGATGEWLRLTVYTPKSEREQAKMSWCS